MRDIIRHFEDENNSLLQSVVTIILSLLDRDDRLFNNFIRELSKPDIKVEDAIRNQGTILKREVVSQEEKSAWSEFFKLLSSQNLKVDFLKEMLEVVVKLDDNELAEETMFNYLQTLSMRFEDSERPRIYKLLRLLKETLSIRKANKRIEGYQNNKRSRQEQDEELRI
jgi:hypothetical protein